MNVTNIKGRMDYIDVYFDNGNVVRIEGELLHGGFHAESSTIKQWKVPAGQPISIEAKNDIIDAVIAKTKGSHMVIRFE